MGTPLKIKILKSVFLHAREDQNFFMNIGPQMAKIRVDKEKPILAPEKQEKCP